MSWAHKIFSSENSGGLFQVQLRHNLYQRTIGVCGLVSRLPQFFNFTRRERREPVKIYHMRDVGVEAT